MRQARSSGDGELEGALLDLLARQATGPVPEDVGKRLLAAAGISVPRSVSVGAPDEGKTWPDLDTPWVVKAVVPGLVHKTEVGAVRLGVAGAAEVAEAMDEIRAAVTAHGLVVDRFLVEEQAEPGHEVIIGAQRAGRHWWLMAGLGGIHVETFRDVAFRFAPVDRGEALDMFHELAASAILRGARGRPGADLEALADLVVQLAGSDGLLARLPATVASLELNPVIASTAGAVVADVVIHIDGGSSRQVDGAAEADADRLLRPRSVGVLGASARRPNLGNAFLAHLHDYGFPGSLVAVHPTALEIEGAPAFPDLASVPHELDYLYITLPADAVTPALRAARPGQVAFAQVISSGFGETPSGVTRERELVAVARERGFRVLGPNCIGTFSPQGRLTFLADPPREVGRVAVVSQSGGLSIDIIRAGAARGLGFHSVVSVGNGADLGPAELVTWWLEEPEVPVIGLYLESVEAGAEVLAAVRAAQRSAPMVLLAGGVTTAGAATAASHTGAIAGRQQLWPAIARQCGALLVEDLESMVVALHALSMAPEISPSRAGVVLIGNGGGTSVLAADAFARAGVAIEPFTDEVVASLEGLGLPPGNGLRNPVDLPAGSLMVDRGAVIGRIVETLERAVRPAIAVVHLNVGVFPAGGGGDADPVVAITESVAAASRKDGPCFVVVLREDGRGSTTERVATARAALAGSGAIAVNSMTEAVAAVRALAGSLREEE